jgi:penicillin-binding protein 2
LIFDRKGRLLAGVKPEVVITAIPNIMRQKPWVIHKLAVMLQANPKKLKDKVEEGLMRPYLPTPIHVGASENVAIQIAEAADHLPGIGVDTVPMRHYPNSRDLTHILGYVWTPDKNDADRFERHKWTLPQYVGKQGIEWWMEEHLKGEPGSETVEVDARRKPVRIVGRENSTPGERVVLTLDRDLQKYANSVLATISAKHPNSGAAMAAIDPQSGEILALASYPTFDTALFKGGISKDDYAVLDQDPLQPMFNRAVSGSYSPGSTFKIVTALAAQQVGWFNPNRTVVCRGYCEVGNRKIKCLGVHGAIAFREALAKSCNAYFGDLAKHAQRNGLNKAAIDLGLGYKTGIELRGETGGSLPTDKWIAKLEARTGKKVDWYQGHTVNVGIGQGEVSATVLQMANALAAVANNGVNYKLHLVKARILDGKSVETKREEAHRIDAPASFWAEVRAGLEAVIDHGTGAGLATIPGVRWAGKTGSTEARGNKLTHSWFIGYAPAQDPKIAIALVVQEAGHGSEVAAPLGRQIVAHYLKGETPSP